MFRPTNVFPAPGTPVKNIIDFLLFSLEYFIISSIVFSVSTNMESSELRVVMFFTSCVSYNCLAASKILGVGTYLDLDQFVKSSFVLYFPHIFAIIFPKLFLFALIMLKILFSLHSYSF